MKFFNCLVVFCVLVISRLMFLFVFLRFFENFLRLFMMVVILFEGIVVSKCFFFLISVFRWVERLENDLEVVEMLVMKFLILLELVVRVFEKVFIF